MRYSLEGMNRVWRENLSFHFSAKFQMRALQRKFRVQTKVWLVLFLRGEKHEMSKTSAIVQISPTPLVGNDEEANPRLRSPILHAAGPWASAIQSRHYVLLIFFLASTRDTKVIRTTMLAKKTMLYTVYMMQSRSVYWNENCMCETKEKAHYKGPWDNIDVWPRLLRHRLNGSAIDGARRILCPISASEVFVWNLDNVNWAI